MYTRSTLISSRRTWPILVLKKQPLLRRSGKQRTLPVGQDPAAVFGQVRLDHGQLYATETKPDPILAYALLNTLDESYAVVK
jgi:hypothetical protein